MDEIPLPSDGPDQSSDGQIDQLPENTEFVVFEQNESDVSQEGITVEEVYYFPDDSLTGDVDTSVENTTVVQINEPAPQYMNDSSCSNEPHYVSESGDGNDSPDISPSGNYYYNDIATSIPAFTNSEEASQDVIQTYSAEVDDAMDTAPSPEPEPTVNIPSEDTSIIESETQSTVQLQVPSDQVQVTSDLVNVPETSTNLTIGESEQQAHPLPEDPQPAPPVQETQSQNETSTVSDMQIDNNDAYSVPPPSVGNEAAMAQVPPTVPNTAAVAAPVVADPSQVPYSAANYMAYQQMGDPSMMHSYYNMTANSYSDYMSMYQSGRMAQQYANPYNPYQNYNYSYPMQSMYNGRGMYATGGYQQMMPSTNAIPPMGSSMTNFTPPLPNAYTAPSFSSEPPKARKNEKRKEESKPIKVNILPESELPPLPEDALPEKPVEIPEIKEKIEDEPESKPADESVVEPASEPEPEAEADAEDPAKLEESEENEDKNASAEDVNRYSPSLAMDEEEREQSTNADDGQAKMQQKVSSVLGKAQAKKRLMAFSISKQTTAAIAAKNKPSGSNKRENGDANVSKGYGDETNEHGVNSGNVFDEKHSKKKTRKSNKVEKARETMEEIEEIKRSEMSTMMYQSSYVRDNAGYENQNLDPSRKGRDSEDRRRDRKRGRSYSRSRSRRRSYSRDRKTRRGDRKYRHRSRSRSRSRSTHRSHSRSSSITNDRKSKIKTSDIKNWDDFSEAGFQLDRYRRIKYKENEKRLTEVEKRKQEMAKSKLRGSRFEDRRSASIEKEILEEGRVKKVNMFETPIELKQAVVTMMDRMKPEEFTEFPSHIIQYTNVRPVLKFCENLKYAKRHFMDREQLMDTVPEDIAGLIKRFLNSVKAKRLKSKLPNDTEPRSQNWWVESPLHEGEPNVEDDIEDDDEVSTLFGSYQPTNDDSNFTHPVERSPMFKSFERPDAAVRKSRFENAVEDGGVNVVVRSRWDSDFEDSPSHVPDRKSPVAVANHISQASVSPKLPALPPGFEEGRKRRHHVEDEQEKPAKKSKDRKHEKRDKKTKKSQLSSPQEYWRSASESKDDKPNEQSHSEKNDPKLQSEYEEFFNSLPVSYQQPKDDNVPLYEGPKPPPRFNDRTTTERPKEPPKECNPPYASSEEEKTKMDVDEEEFDVDRFFAKEKEKKMKKLSKLNEESKKSAIEEESMEEAVLETGTKHSKKKRDKNDKRKKKKTISVKTKKLKKKPKRKKKKYESSSNSSSEDSDESESESSSTEESSSASDSSSSSSSSSSEDSSSSVSRKKRKLKDKKTKKKDKKKERKHADKSKKKKKKKMRTEDSDSEGKKKKRKTKDHHDKKKKSKKTSTTAAAAAADESSDVLPHKSATATKKPESEETVVSKKQAKEKHKKRKKKNEKEKKSKDNADVSDGGGGSRKRKKSKKKKGPSSDSETETRTTGWKKNIIDPNEIEENVAKARMNNQFFEDHLNDWDGLVDAAAPLADVDEHPMRDGSSNADALDNATTQIFTERTRTSKSKMESNKKRKRSDDNSLKNDVDDTIFNKRSMTPTGDEYFGTNVAETEQLQMSGLRSNDFAPLYSPTDYVQEETPKFGILGENREKISFSSRRVSRFSAANSTSIFDDQSGDENQAPVPVPAPVPPPVKPAGMPRTPPGSPSDVNCSKSITPDSEPPSKSFSVRTKAAKKFVHSNIFDSFDDRMLDQQPHEQPFTEQNAMVDCQQVETNSIIPPEEDEREEFQARPCIALPEPELPVRTTRSRSPPPPSSSSKARSPYRRSSSRDRDRDYDRDRDRDHNRERGRDRGRSGRRRSHSRDRYRKYRHDRYDHRRPYHRRGGRSRSRSRSRGRRSSPRDRNNRYRHRGRRSYSKSETPDRKRRERTPPEPEQTKDRMYDDYNRYSRSPRPPSPAAVTNREAEADTQSIMHQLSDMFDYMKKQGYQLESMDFNAFVSMMHSAGMMESGPVDMPKMMSMYQMMQSRMAHDSSVARESNDMANQSYQASANKTKKSVADSTNGGFQNRFDERSREISPKPLSLDERLERELGLKRTPPVRPPMSTPTLPSPMNMNPYYPMAMPNFSTPPPNIRGYPPQAMMAAAAANPSYYAAMQAAASMNWTNAQAFMGQTVAAATAAATSTTPRMMGQPATTTPRMMSQPVTTTPRMMGQPATTTPRMMGPTTTTTPRMQSPAPIPGRQPIQPSSQQTVQPNDAKPPQYRVPESISSKGSHSISVGNLVHIVPSELQTPVSSQVKMSSPQVPASSSIVSTPNTKSPNLSSTVTIPPSTNFASILDVHLPVSFAAAPAVSGSKSTLSKNKISNKDTKSSADSKPLPVPSLPAAGLCGSKISNLPLPPGISDVEKKQLLRLSKEKRKEEKALQQLLKTKGTADHDEHNLVEEMEDSDEPRLPISIKPSPEQGILISPGFKDKSMPVTPLGRSIIGSARKMVSFVDGVRPGAAKGDDSPPTKARKSPPVVPTKKKHKVRVKIVRPDDSDDDDSPPPPPPGPPPPDLYAPPPLPPQQMNIVNVLAAHGYMLPKI